jgi:hypothetical protein
MKKLTSDNTHLHKRVFPGIYFGFCGVFFLATLVLVFTHRIPIFFPLHALFMVVFGYFIMKTISFDLVDEVYDYGDALLFRNAGKSVRVNLSDIEWVKYLTGTHLPRVTILLKVESELGDRLTFLAQGNWIPFKKHRNIEDLIKRVDNLEANKEVEPDGST